MEMVKPIGFFISVFMEQLMLLNIGIYLKWCSPFEDFLWQYLYNWSILSLFRLYEWLPPEVSSYYTHVSSFCIIEKHSFLYSLCNLLDITKDLPLSSSFFMVLLILSACALSLGFPSSVILIAMPYSLSRDVYSLLAYWHPSFHYITRL